MTCKILALVDSLGNLIKFRLMPGQYHDLVETKPLIEDVDFQALLADKAFDADWLIQELNERKVKVVIPPKSNRKVMRGFDTIMSLYTTNFTEPLSYQDSAFLKLPKFP